MDRRHRVLDGALLGGVASISDGDAVATRAQLRGQRIESLRIAGEHGDAHSLAGQAPHDRTSETRSHADHDGHLVRHARRRRRRFRGEACRRRVRRPVPQPARERPAKMTPPVVRYAHARAQPSDQGHGPQTQRVRLLRAVPHRSQHWMHDRAHTRTRKAADDPKMFLRPILRARRGRCQANSGGVACAPSLRSTRQSYRTAHPEQASVAGS